MRMDLQNTLYNLYLSTPFDWKEKIIRWAVYNECTILSAQFKHILSNILNKENIRIINRDGYWDHRSLRVFQEDPESWQNNNIWITVDLTIAQFIPAMKGKVFIWDDTELVTFLNNNDIVDPHTLEPSQASKADLFKALYWEIKNNHAFEFNHNK